MLLERVREARLHNTDRSFLSSRVSSLRVVCSLNVKATAIRADHTGTSKQLVALPSAMVGMFSRSHKERRSCKPPILWSTTLRLRLLANHGCASPGTWLRPHDPPRPSRHHHWLALAQVPRHRKDGRFQSRVRLGPTGDFPCRRESLIHHSFATGREVVDRVEARDADSLLRRTQRVLRGKLWRGMNNDIETFALPEKYCTVDPRRPPS